jgi:hypothetical protein
MLANLYTASKGRFRFLFIYVENIAVFALGHHGYFTFSTSKQLIESITIFFLRVILAIRMPVNSRVVKWLFKLLGSMWLLVKCRHVWRTSALNLLRFIDA